MTLIYLFILLFRKNFFSNLNPNAKSFSPKAKRHHHPITPVYKVSQIIHLVQSWILLWWCYKTFLKQIIYYSFLLCIAVKSSGKMKNEFFGRSFSSSFNLIIYLLYWINLTRVIWSDIYGIFISQFYYQLRIDTTGEDSLMLINNFILTEESNGWKKNYIVSWRFCHWLSQINRWYTVS